MSSYPLLEAESQVTQQNESTFTVNLAESFAVGTGTHAVHETSPY